MEKLSFPRRTINPSFIIKRSASATGNFCGMQSDMVISVDGVAFVLHKIPLTSRSGKIRKLVEELSETEATANLMLEFHDFPGGPDNFELVAKFCYNIKFEISISNVAQLRCAAEFLEMSDEFGDENLQSRTEAFLNEVVFQTIEKSAAVLHTCAPILQHAEETKLVNRCIDVIASKVCNKDTIKEHIISAFSTDGCCCSNDFKTCPNSKANSSTLHPYHKGLNPNFCYECVYDKISNSTLHIYPNPNLAPNNDQDQPIFHNDCTALKEWWVDNICDLKIDLFQRLLSAMKSYGLKNESLGGAVIHYALKTLKPLGRKPVKYESKSKVKLTIGGHPGLITSKAMEHEQRILLESIVGMLPRKKYICSTKFLLGLLKNAILLDTTVACRLDLERRVGAQLEDASVHDLLIHGDQEMTRFDVDVVQRVVETYLQQVHNAADAAAIGQHLLMGGGEAGGQVILEQQQLCRTSYTHESDSGPNAESRASNQFRNSNGRCNDGIVKVGKLMDLYLAEVAIDPHLQLSKFSTLAGLLPDHARLLDDGLYRAIDMYLKGHPNLSDMERRRICKLLDCQKLSQEACVHAAQNERLPVQVVVQVLHLEQLRMHTAIAADGKVGLSLDPFSSLRRDNRELKLEVARLRLRINELEKENGVLKEATAAAGSASGGFFSLLSHRFHLLTSSSPRKCSKQPSHLKPPPRRRRHSIS